MTKIIALAFVATLAAAAHAAVAQTILKEEPKRNLLKHGKVVLVDDGSCPVGQIKEVTGGKNDAATDVKRTRRCVPKK
jgi:hypothetical protein